MFFIFACKLWVNRPSRTTSNYTTLGDTKQSACSRASTRCGQKPIFCISGWRYWNRMAHTRFTWNRNQFVQGVMYVCVSAVLFIYVYTISGTIQASIESRSWRINAVIYTTIWSCRWTNDYGKKWLYTISKLVGIPTCPRRICCHGIATIDDERRDVSSPKTKTFSTCTVCVYILISRYRYGATRYICIPAMQRWHRRIRKEKKKKI